MNESRPQSTASRRPQLPRSRRRALAVIFGFLAVASMMIWSVYSLAVTPFEPVYHYETARNASGPAIDRIDEQPDAGRHFVSVEADFATAHARDPQLQLFRTTARDWTNFLAWYDNVTHPRWRVPYRKSSGG